MILSIGIGILGWFIGIFGWAQIIGTLQNLQEFGPAKSARVISISAVAMLLVAVLFWKVFLTDYILALLIGYAAGLITILFQGKIE